MTLAGSERAVRTLGAAGSVEQLRETLVPLGDGRTVRLGDLGTVEDKWSEPRRLARYNGQEAVTFNFLRSREASEVKVAERVREEVARIDEAQWAEQPWPHLQDWLQRWIDSALFAEVMETYPGWVAGTTGPLFSAASVESD